MWAGSSEAGRVSTHEREHYRAETRRLVGRRGPMCTGLFASGVLIASLIEYAYHPERLPYLLLFFGLELAACLVTLGLYRIRRLRHAGIALMHLACIAVLACVTGYASATGAHAAAVGFLFIVFTLTTALMFPWGLQNQLIMALAGILLYTGYVIRGPSTASELLVAQGLYAIVAAGLLSVLGAAILDRQRSALFVQRERLDQHIETFRELTRTFHGFDAPRVVSLTCTALLNTFDLWRLWIVWPVAGADAHGYTLGYRHGSVDWQPEINAETLWQWIRKRPTGGQAFVSSPTDAPPVGREAHARWEAAGQTLCIPIQSRGECRAVIYAHRGEERLELGERELALASVVASGMAIALANAELYEQVRTASEEKSIALARIAHELRNPLQAILWDLDILGDAPASTAAQTAERLAQVRGHADMTLAMARELQDFAEVETRRLEADPEPVNLVDTFANLRAIALPLIEQRPITFETTVAPGAEAVHTDPFRLRQILGNLIANAAKFTEHGSITLQAEPVGHDVLISVRDTGIGIPEAECRRIFQPFYRTGSGANRPRGMGLGLAIVKELACLLGGRIEVESALGQGSTFHLRLPIGHAALPRDATSGIAPETSDETEHRVPTSA